MGTTDEEKDKSGKPPLLPKPCLSSPVAGPGENAIPQMVVTSADDVIEELSNAPPLPLQPEIIVAIGESSTDKVDEIKEEETINQIPLRLGKQDGEQETPEIPQSDAHIKSSETIPHSVSQRPLAIESEKPSPNENEQKIDSDSVKSSLTTKQRPLVFDGSKVQHEAFKIESEPEKISEPADINDDIGTNFETNEESKIKLSNESDTYAKSSGFSWLPSFPKIHAATKETKEKSADALDSQNAPCSPKKEGLQKFFESFKHDVKTEPKDLAPKTSDEEKTDEKIKAPKDSKSSAKKFFDSFKHDDKVIKNNEAKKQLDDSPKDQSQDTKQSVKKFFDSLVHDTSSQKSKIIPKENIELPTSSHEQTTESPSSPKEQKESKTSVKKFFDSLVHDTSTPKSKIISKENIEIPISTSLEQTIASPSSPKESKTGVKKFFDSLGLDTSTPKSKIIPKENIEISVSSSLEQTIESPSSPKEQKESKTAVKKFFDSLGLDTSTPKSKIIPKENIEIPVSSSLEQTTETPSSPKAEKESKTSVKKFFDSFRHDSSESKDKKQIKDDNVQIEASPILNESNMPSKEGKDNLHSVKKFFTSLKPETPKEKPLELELTEEKLEENKQDQHKESSHGVKKLLESFKHSEDHKEKSIDASKPSEPIVIKDQQNERHQSKKTFFESFKHHALEEHKPKYAEDLKSDDAATVEPKEKLHGVKKFFDSFKHDVPEAEKEKPSDSSDKGKETQSPKKEQPKEGMQGVKKFFESFKHETPDESKSKLDKHSESIKEPTTSKDHGSGAVKKFFDSFKDNQGEEKKIQPIKSTVDVNEVHEPSKDHKGGVQGVKKFFDSFSSKESQKIASSPTDKSEHIYDIVDIPYSPPPSGQSTELVYKESAKASNPDVKPKEGHHGVKKLFDSFRHKDPSLKPKIEKKNIGKPITDADKAESSILKVHFDQEVKDSTPNKDIPVEAKKDEPKPEQHSMKKFFSSIKTKDSLNLSSSEKSDESTKQKDESIQKIPKIKINEPSTSTESSTKLSMFESLKPKFSLKEKTSHKEEKKEKKSDASKIQEYDLQKGNSSNEVPEQLPGKFKPLDDSEITPSSKTDDHNKKSEEEINKESILKAPRASVEIKDNDESFLITKPTGPPKFTKTTDTPDSLYETCCIRLAVLLRNKAIEIVSDQTRVPPKKPPKPSAEAIARARAAAVSRRIQELQKRQQNFGDDIPVGINGIRYADDETESSCDYKDVANLDYIMDYELINRYKFDNKVDTFSVPSTGESYYTADNVTLKDEYFSDNTLESISLGSNDSYSIKSPTLSQNKSDTRNNVLGNKIQAKSGIGSKLSSGKIEKTSTNIKSQIPLSSPGKTPHSGQKKVPPPIPPKPLIPYKPKSQQISSTKSSLLKEPVSQCVNGLSLSPRLQKKGINDSSETKSRPLMVAGVKETEFSSLRHNKEAQKNLAKGRKFNTVLKNESLKNISAVSSSHPPLSYSKSSPSALSNDRKSPNLSLSRKISPPRPPPPVILSKKEEKPMSRIPPQPPEKPKRESVLTSSTSPKEKRTISPPRPPPPVIKTSIKPPRPPPPVVSNSYDYSIVDSCSQESAKTESYEPIDSKRELIFEGSFSPCADLQQQSNLLSQTTETIESSQVKNQITSSLASENNELSEQENLTDTKISTGLKPGNELQHKEIPYQDSSQLSSETEKVPTIDVINAPTDMAMTVTDKKPRPPPRVRRIRSRTVEIVPLEKLPDSRARRSHSLTEIDIEKKIASLGVTPQPEKTELKSLYTAVNKDNKKNNLSEPKTGLEIRSSSLETVSTRPLPAPPPPPRKFRSLDRKPKSKKEKVKDESETQMPQENSLPEMTFDTSSLKPPARKRKTEKDRFLSLGHRDKKEKGDSFTASISRSASVPLRPERKSKQSHESHQYDENANLAIPIVAEIHHNDSQLDEPDKTICDISQDIPCPSTIESEDNKNAKEKLKPHPRQKKSRKTSRSSWYDDNKVKEDSWEVVDFNPNDEEYIKLKNEADNITKSDHSKEQRPTSTFYINVDEELEPRRESPSLVDKETSPLPLDCSEKSVQTSLETLSKGAISHDEHSEDTDELLDLAQTLQNELKVIINRHKSNTDLNEMEVDDAPADDLEKDLEFPEKRRKADSIRSSTSEIWQISSSEESDGEFTQCDSTNLTEIAMNRKQKKIFYIAQEIMTSEEVFVDALKLLIVDFKAAVEEANKQKNTKVIPDEILCQILNHLPQLQHLNENLLMELKDRIENWSKLGKIADIIVKIGPFLKLYSWYIHEFESNVALLEDSKKKYPLFAQVVKEFEMSTRCKRLSLNHYMLKPIQRIPQYRLLLQEYLHHLSEDSLDYQDTLTALQIVSEVANHANDQMKLGDDAQKLISIQNSIIGHKEIVKPGRAFVKEGELMKLSRKGMQPRWFVLFNDLLLYLTPVQQGLYRVNHELPLTGMKVAIPIQQDYQNEFSIISVTRSFTLAAKSQEERQEWIIALTKAIEENASKRSTFTNVRLQQRAQERSSEEDDGAFVLGKKAPVWIPDSRVTMCQLCTSEFTVTFRRHHCRACGKVVCSICSSNRISLPYLGNRIARVCDECHLKLGPGSACCTESGETDSDNQQIAVKSHLRTDHRYKKGKRNLPSVLKEVCANDQGSTISGYLQKRTGKSWKRDWFVVKDKVLYEYKASEDVAALRSIPLLGYQIESFSEPFENIDSSLLFQLTHPGQAPIIFHADTSGTAERWIAALKEASVLE